VLRALPVYALIFAAGMMQSALAPLGPAYAAELGLTRVQVGALFAAASVAMVVVALPIGMVTDRLGARRLTIAAALLVGLSALGQGLARDFWLLFASRAAFGVAFAAVWTAGLAFLAEGGTVGRRSALGATIPVTGASSAIGPAFAGVIAGRFGLSVPFVAIAAMAVVVATALAFVPAALTSERIERADLAALLRAIRRNRLVAGAVAIMTVAGFSSSLAYLLIPLRLRSNGVSVAAIGTTLGAAAVLYIAAGLIVARFGPRATKPAVAGGVVAVLGFALVIPVVTTATAALAGFLLARSACNAAMSTIAYPLASEGAAELGFGAGSAIGLVNAAWATSTVVAPLAGGAVAQATSDRVAFAVLVPITLATGAWLLSSRVRRGRATSRGARPRH
jgi:MFS transporter, DHA1 family, solute carrier family 18 (vesicular amine transporter), member 1/2